MDKAEVNALMAQYKDLYEMNEAKIASLQADLAAVTNPLRMLESRIKDAVVELGESVEHLGVKATYRSGYVRERWDGDALRGYAMAHPEILAARSETKIKPSVSVKVVIE